MSYRELPACRLCFLEVLGVTRGRCVSAGRVRGVSLNTALCSASYSNSMIVSI